MVRLMSQATHPSPRFKYSIPRPGPSSIQMFLSPLCLSTDSLSDLLDPVYPQSPQLSQISPLPVQSPQVDAFWHGLLLDTVSFPPKLESEVIPPHLLDVDFDVSPDRRSRRPLLTRTLSGTTTRLPRNNRNR